MDGGRTNKRQDSEYSDFCMMPWRRHRAHIGCGVVAPSEESNCPGTCSSLVMQLVYELQILLPGGPAPSGVNIVLGELMLRHTSDIDTDFILIGSQTQRICIMLRHY